jgi:hypothetical protein
MLIEYTGELIRFCFSPKMWRSLICFDHQAATRRHSREILHAGRGAGQLLLFQGG